MRDSDAEAVAAVDDDEEKKLEKPLGDRDEWASVTGKFKALFDRMDKDSEENTEKVRQATASVQKNCGDIRDVAKTVKR